MLRGYSRQRGVHVPGFRLDCYPDTISDVRGREHARSEKRIRCGWASSDSLLMAYHDREWGVPLHDDRALFEFVVLEGAQAGLSWSTILKKRPAYRSAFDNFNPRKVARYSDAKIALL